MKQMVEQHNNNHHRNKPSRLNDFCVSKCTTSPQSHFVR